MNRFLKDETIKKYIEKYGKQGYLDQIHSKLQEQEKEYQRGRNHLLYILERVEKDFN